ncbi:MAG: glucose 1-dehydrogenase [Myxococcota bacterium]|nr:glucose 1-dehydrogenase [Myxococcota bacterium]
MAGRLDGRIAIVTGGTRGIGEAIATALLADGATVVVSSRKPAGVADAVARLEAAAPGRVHGVPCNMGRLEQIHTLYDAAVEVAGLPDILINNAATNPYFGPMMGLEFPAWEKTFDVNLKGPFALTRLFARGLIAAGARGAVVNVSSIYGLHAAPLQGIYGMTKAALVSLTQTLAAELAPSRIRVNCVAPGLIETRFSQAITSDPEYVSMYTGRAAQSRVGGPADVAGAAAWLVSDAAGFITGQTITVDGGYLMK